VYRKCAGGGLLRLPRQIDAILGALRDAVTVKFTVKTRIGFDSADGYGELLAILARHHPDLVTVHARTVKEMYRSPVRYELIRQAAEFLPCPVLANGNVYSAAKGLEVLASTGARGLMIGRGAIRNPWIFRQFRQHLAGEPIFVPRGFEVLEYVEALYETVCSPEVREASQVQRMKKYMNYLGVGVEPTGRFLHEIRRASTRDGFFALCREFLDHDRAMPLEPFPLALPETDLMAGEQL
jgi:tRNA-dihydrouridine synthase